MNKRLILTGLISIACTLSMSVRAEVDEYTEESMDSVNDAVSAIEADEAGDDSSPTILQVLKAAPAQAISTALDSCRSWAVEDQVEAAALDEYLLLCVNEQLEYEGYLPVDAL